MISLSHIENMVMEIPHHKIQNLMKYVKNKEPSSLSLTDIQEELNLTSYEANTVTRIFKQTSDGDILSVAIEAVLRNQTQNKINTKLVMTGKFRKKSVDYTHETVYQMINRAKARITIVGYWVYDMQDLFTKLSELQEKNGLEIKFVLDSGKKWAPRIKRNWNKKFLPKIFEVNKDHVKSLHAKIIIIDDSEILITSANLTINAMEENIEAGIWSCDKNIVNACTEIFQDYEDRKIISEVQKKIY